MKRIEMEVWEPCSDDPQKRRYIGQRTAQEVFAELRYRLDNMGYLPADYFLLDEYWEHGREIPKGAVVFCATGYDDKEGICLDVFLKWFDGRERKPVSRGFASGKTPGESGADLDRTHLISSAIIKAFYTDGDHARYIRLGEPAAEDGTILHLAGEEQRLLIDALVSWRSMMLNGGRETEQLLRRVAGSVTRFIGETGEKPLWISDYDRAVLAIQDGDAGALLEARHKISNRAGELLVAAAGRPGDAGMEMTLSLLPVVRDAPRELFLAACKDGIATGDVVRMVALLSRAADCVKDLDQGFYGEVICFAMTEHKHITEALIEQCAPEALAAADPWLLAEALRQGDLGMAHKLVKSGIDANQNAAECIRALIWRTDHRDWFEDLTESGIRIDGSNYAAMFACIDTNNLDAAKLLLDQGMDFDAFVKWAKGRVQLKPGETLDTIQEHWKIRRAGWNPEVAAGGD